MPARPGHERVVRNKAMGIRTQRMRALAAIGTDRSRRRVWRKVTAQAAKQSRSQLIAGAQRESAYLQAHDMQVLQAHIAQVCQELCGTRPIEGARVL